MVDELLAFASVGAVALTCAMSYRLSVQTRGCCCGFSTSGLSSSLPGRSSGGSARVPGLERGPLTPAGLTALGRESRAVKWIAHLENYVGPGLLHQVVAN